MTMRNFWASEFPVGDPQRGVPFGERTDPATIGPAVEGAGSAMRFVGGIGAGRAARRAGERAQATANFEAAQLHQRAGQEVAASQRTALEERRRAELVASRAVAVAAASGGGVSDPTVSDLLADIEGEGAYRAGVELYQGEERARLLNMGADAKTFEGEILKAGGKDRQRAYVTNAFGSLATGGTSLYGKYGMGGPKKAAGRSTSNTASWFDAGSEGYSSIG